MRAFRRASARASIGSSSTATRVAPVTSPSPSEEMIAQRAYQKWLERGCPRDTEVQNWLEAEAELKAELSERRRV
jgi:hypothetical protein